MAAASPSATSVVPLACQTAGASACACCCRQTAYVDWGSTAAAAAAVDGLLESLVGDLGIASVLQPHRALCVDWIATHGVILGCVGVMVCVAVVTRLAVVVTWMIVAMGPTVVVVVV